MVHWPVTTKSPEETQSFAEQFAGELQGGEIILLSGDLGSGKTTFIRGLARGLNIDDPDGVSSPSYTIINDYPGEVTLLHVDLYRLNDDQEIIELALEELLTDNSVMAIEWGERLPMEFGKLFHLDFTVIYEDVREINLVN